jgi:hypothetical protein
MIGCRTEMIRGGCVPPGMDVRPSRTDLSARQVACGLGYYHSRWLTKAARLRSTLEYDTEIIGVALSVLLALAGRKFKW